MAFQLGRARAEPRCRSRAACLAFGTVALLALWAFDGLAASMPPLSHRHFLSEASRVERGAGSGQLPVERGARTSRWAGPPSTGLGQDTPSTSKSDELQESDSIAVIIDGDVASKQSIADALEELRQHGQVVLKRLFAEPGRVGNRKWNSFLHSNGIEYRRVERRTDPFRDPNDDAIMADVRKLLQGRRIGAVALIVGDQDYIPLVEDIVGAGRRCFVKLGGFKGLAVQYKKAGCQILAQRPGRFPKYIGVLHSDGNGSIKKASVLPGRLDWDDEEVQQIPSRLLALGYMSSSDDPLIPAVAKFWLKNGLGDLIVYPSECALISLAEIFRRRSFAKYVPGRRDVAFIFPLRICPRTRSVLDKYGTKCCAAYVKVGIGPFLLANSQTMVDDMLRRMGFVDDDLNADFQEGLDVFAIMNMRALRKSRIQFSDSDTTQEKEDKIRTLCLSESCTGQFQPPPDDSNVRAKLYGEGMLKSLSTPKAGVFRAMASSVSSAGLVAKKTYNGRLVQCLDVLCNRKHHPQRRQ